MGTEFVCVVAKDRAFRELLAKVLRTDGDYQITKFDTGGEFLGKLREPLPGVIIIDLDAPEVGGMAVLSELRKRNIVASTIGLSEYSSIGAAVQATKLGAADVVGKPCDPERLREAVDVCCCRSQVRRNLRESHENSDTLKLNWDRIGRILQLTRRQREIAECICHSMANDGIAFKLGISSNTVKMHIKSLYEKLGVCDRVGVALRCVGVGLTSGGEDNGQGRN